MDLPSTALSGIKPAANLGEVLVEPTIIDSSIITPVDLSKSLTDVSAVFLMRQYISNMYLGLDHQHAQEMDFRPSAASRCIKRKEVW